jgi:hypothetical protein
LPLIASLHSSLKSNKKARESVTRTTEINHQSH